MALPTHLKINGKLINPNAMERVSYHPSYPHEGPLKGQPVITFYIGGVQMDEYGGDAAAAWKVLQENAGPSPA